MSAFSVFTSFKAKDGVTPVFQSMVRRGNAFQEQIIGLSRNFKTAFQGISAELNKVKTGFNNFTDKLFTMKNAIMGVAAGTLVKSVLAAGQSFVDMASDLVETQGKVDVVFGSMSDSVYKWAQSSIKNMGLAQQTALDSAALFGDMGVGMDIPVAKAAEMAMSLTQLSADLASFKNISNDMAKTALKGVYTGETEALKGLGVVMTQAALQEFAQTKGIHKKISAMKTAEQVELRYQYVLAKTKNAQGDFLRTGGNAANQMRVYSETLKEIQTNFGMAILPEYTKILTRVNELLKENMPVIQSSFESMYSGVKKIYRIFVGVYNVLKVLKENLDSVAIALIGLATPFLFANLHKIVYEFQFLKLAMTEMLPLVWRSVVAFTAQAAALMTNPLVWIPMAIAGLILLIKHFDKVKEKWEQFISRFKKEKAENDVNVTYSVKDKMESSNIASSADNLSKNQTKVNTDIPKFASGTQNFGGGLAIVGEKGPELVSLPPRTQIFSNQNTIDIFKNSAIERYHKVINIEDYVTKKGASYNPVQSNNSNSSNENIIYLEIELNTPEGYEAKVVNAKSTSGREFKVKLRGKRKQ